MPIGLYDYQLEALGRMKNGCILCGGVGSGKSRTALAYYFTLNEGRVDTPEYYPMNDPPQDLYIITTAKKRDSREWEGDMVPFLLTPDPEKKLYCHMVVVDSWNNIKKYENVKNAFFIFDEQRLVGSGTWVRAFLKIAKTNDWILLSATPGDTWTDYIPVFIANGFYKNKTEFIREHVVYRRFVKYPQVDRYLNTKRLERLRDRILVNMNFQRETVAHHSDIWCQYDRVLYKRLIKERWNVWEDRPIINASELCYSLRKVVNSDESRAYETLQLTKTHPRAIIFYNFDYELECLKNLAYEPNTEVAEWNGHKHQPIPNSERWVYLVQYNAGAEGWSCITTDTIIFYSQNYSYKVLIQASGRIDRLNTPYHDLYYYHLKSRAGIDLAIQRAVMNKKRFNENGFARRFK